MKTSLVLCTRNGADRLQHCLQCITELDVEDGFEVILVDNASNDGVSYEIAQRYAEESRHKVLLLRTEIPGNAAGRNRALEAATGDLIVFIDDDCYPSRTMVKDWISVFSSDDIGYGGGTITNYDDRYPEFGCSLIKEDRWAMPKKTVPRGFIQGSNMAFRTACLKDIGWFDERLGAGTPYAGEDWDMSIRASLRGWKGRCARAPSVQHDHRRNVEIADKRTLYYDFGAGVLYAKHLFTPLGFRMLYRLIDEIVTLRSDAPRAQTLLKGFVHYFWKFPKAKATT